MLALALLLGATCAAGLLFSVWPWGLHPVPIAGIAFSAVVLVGAVRGRRPSLPKPALSDLVPLGAAGALGAFMSIPLFRSANVQLSVMGEDLFRHMQLYEAVRHVGGYAFLHHDQAREFIFEGLVMYPQGSHLTSALLDGFFRSDAGDFGGGFSMLAHYQAYTTLTFVMFFLSMAWAVRWLAGPAMTLGRYIAMTGVLLVLAPLTGLMGLPLLTGYPSQIYGLMIVALLVAVVCRPLPRVNHQVLVLASLLVAVGFSYYLYLPPAALAVACWLVRHRTKLWRHHRLVTLTVLLPAGALSVVPTAMGLLLADQSQALTVSGGPRPSDSVLVTLGCVVLIGLLGARARRAATWRGYLWTALSFVAFSATMWLATHDVTGGLSYYTGKSLHAILVVLAIGVGALALRMPTPLPARRGPLPVLTSATAGVLALVALGAAVGLGPNDVVYDVRASSSVAPYRAARHNHVNPDDQAIFREYQRTPATRPVITVVLGANLFQSYRRTLGVNALRKTAAPGMYNPPGAIFDKDQIDLSLNQFQGPVRLVVSTPEQWTWAQQVKARHRERTVDVVKDY